jgi:D-aminopeptidase
LPQWQFLPGPYNAITDVAGVSVGHVSIKQDQPHTLRTGVTAIMPHAGNMANQALWAASSVLNGNGEMTGLATIDHTGLLNSPVVLTNTMAVGQAHQGVHQYYQQHYGDTWPGQLPVVTECWDGVFNTINDLKAVTPAHVINALEQAQTGPILQGRAGAGTGMRAFGCHAGVGTASRQVQIDDKTYTVGILVNANHSHLSAMAPHVKNALEQTLKKPLATLAAEDNRDAVFNHVHAATSDTAATPRQGSIVVIIATDAPLLPAQLKQLANRAALGIGATGSTMDTTSGDFALAFSTAAKIPVGDAQTAQTVTLPSPIIHPDALSDLQRATVEAVTEAQMQAIIAAHQP